MRPEVQGFFDEATNTISYAVTDPQTGKCAIIDSVLDFDQASGRTGTASADRIIRHVRQHGLKVDWIIDTHVHADHLTAAGYLKKQIGGRTGIGEHITAVQRVFSDLYNEGEHFSREGAQFDHLFTDRENYRIGTLKASVLHVPGHTPACMAHLIGDAVFVGDTLFMPDFGTARCDFPGGDARQLYHSIQKIYDLPDSTRMFVCHDYKAAGRDEFVWETTVAAQKRENIHLSSAVTEETFVKLRTKRDAGLAMPDLILPSVQVNIRAGEMPAPENNGVSYLKVPVNQL